MAEERLIDDDKDRKYKIRKNADGEDELYIDGDEEEETPEFEVRDVAEDDEEAAVLTPEQLAARERMRREEEEARQKKLDGFLLAAREKIAAGEFDAALYDASEAIETDGANGEAWALKLRALSHDFNAYTLMDDCAEASEGVKRYSSDEEKAELDGISSPIRAKLAEFEDEYNRLSAENEQKKSERREVFTENRRRALKFFALTVSPFALFLALAIAFACVYFAVDGITNLTLFIVFSALAFVTLAVLLFAVKKLVAAQSKVSLNEKNSSTKLGRQVDKTASDVAALRAIISSFEVKNDDISR